MPHDSPGLYFSDTKVNGEIRTVSSPRGDKCRWGGLKLVTFDEKRAITRKRYTIDAYFLLYMLYQMAMFPMILGDLSTPKPFFLHFSSPFIIHIFVVSKHRDFMFGVQVDPADGQQNFPERGVVTSRYPFLPRDTLLSAVYVCLSVCLSVCVCVSVCHTPVLYQNG